MTLLAQATTAAVSTAPWWGVGAITGGAVVAGAVVTQVLGRSTENRKLREARIIALDHAEREAIIDFITAVSGYIPKTNTDDQAIHLVSIAELFSAYNRLCLYLAGPMKKLAGDLYEAATDLGSQRMAGELTVAAAVAYRDATRAFTEAAQEHIKP